MNIPKSAYLFLTENCNLRCRHCYGSFTSNEDLSVRKWKKIIDDLIEHRVFNFDLAGGEPTYYKGFTDIVKYLIERNQYFSVITNGIFSKSKEVELIKGKDNITSIKISMDGFDYESYNYLRQIGDEKVFNDLVKRIKLYIAEGLKVVLGINIHSSNIDSLDKFCEFINYLSPYAVQISTIVNAGRAKELPDNDKYYNLKKLSMIRKSFNDKIKNSIIVEFVDMPFENPSGFGYSCPALEGFIAVSHKGILLPCPLFNEVELKGILELPDLNKRTLKGCMESEEIKTVMGYKKTDCKYEGRVCGNKDMCGRCLAQSLLCGGVDVPPDFCLQYKETIFGDINA